MENIHCINETFQTEFDFSELSLAQPTPVQGGSYFTRIKNKNQLDLYAYSIHINTYILYAWREA